MKSISRSIFARSLMTGAASLALVMASAAVVRAETVTVQGDDGAGRERHPRPAWRRRRRVGGRQRRQRYTRSPTRSTKRRRPAGLAAKGTKIIRKPPAAMAERQLRRRQRP